MAYELFEGDEGLTRLRDEWVALEERGADHVFQTYAHARRWQDIVGNAIGAVPLVVALREDGRVVGLFPACRQRVNGIPMITWIGAPHVLDYGDILFDADAATITVDTFVAESLSILRRRARWSLLYLTNVREDARAIGPLRSRMRFVKESSAPYVKIEGTHAEYLASLSRRTRHGLNKVDRHIEKAGTVVFRALPVGHPETAAAMDLIVAMQRERFRAMGRKTILFDDDYVRYRLDQAMCDPHSVVTTLTFNGSLIAASLNLVFRDRLYALMNSYNSEFSELSPGRVLHSRGVKLCFERGWNTYDFCWGDEPYKFSWTPHSVKLTTLVADNPAGALMASAAAWRRRKAEAPKAKAGAEAPPAATSGTGSPAPGGDAAVEPPSRTEPEAQDAHEQPAGERP